ncbi:hypothetical protein Pryu01_00954 [Paraliobacillus ryukyuensis]|uniref:Putative adhesin n=1 Tax=Paraliobacillus ryukyuensis TaxID=200904 RepID=A0A366EDI6_9BACI|nr:DUF4097 family beta strand repeat-containing protein [Paraliobacillus ryukyuensis]RBP00474.1 putative adhesin [Paraliobacillus ryukyuensis]
MKKIAGIAFIACIIGIIGIVFFREDLFAIGDYEKITENKTFDASNIEALDVAVNVADTTIEQSADSSIHVHLVGKVSERTQKQMKYEVYEEAGTVIIQLNQTGAQWFNFSILPSLSFNKLDLVIQLPDKMFKKLMLSSDVAELNILYGDFQSVNITSDVGDIQIENTKTSQVTIEADDGDIDIENGLGSWEITSDVGDTDISLDTWNNDVLIYTNVGEIDVELPVLPNQFKMDLASDVGEVETTGIPQSREASDDDNVYLEIGADGPLLQLKSDVGDVGVSVE